MFHRNDHEPKGLVAATRALIARPFVEDVFKEAVPVSSVGVTEFLLHHTSTVEWETVASMLERARVLNHFTYEDTLKVTLCSLVKNGKFEKRHKRGCRAQYRRVGAHAEACE